MDEFTDSTSLRSIVCSTPQDYSVLISMQIVFRIYLTAIVKNETHAVLVRSASGSLRSETAKQELI